MPTLAHNAAIAHVVYSPEVRPPVEVGADQETHLVQWLSKRLGTPVKVPHFSAEGFDLVGGRLLPGEQGPVALFMYQDRQGRRLTLYVRTDAAENRETAFRYTLEGKVSVFYWLDGQLGYALSGELPRLRTSNLIRKVFATGATNQQRTNVTENRHADPTSAGYRTIGNYAPRSLRRPA